MEASPFATLSIEPLTDRYDEKSFTSGIAEKWQGKKLGQFLLMDALRRSMDNTREIGVVVDTYADRAENIHLHHDRKLFPA